MKTLTITIGAVVLATTLFANPFQTKGHDSVTPPAMAQHEGMKRDKPVVAKMVKGIQRMTVVIDGGMYRPAVISVKRGKPVELTFRAGKNPGCGSTVVFKSLKISKVIPKGKPVVIKFTPKKAGDIAFTCSMDMYVGKVIVK